MSFPIPQRLSSTPPMSRPPRPRPPRPPPPRAPNARRSADSSIGHLTFDRLTATAKRVGQGNLGRETTAREMRGEEGVRTG
eukprot:105432-Hanusia_phi.AAC.6